MPPNTTSSDNLRARVNAVKDLLGLFKWERLIYLIVTLISVCVSMPCARRRNSARACVNTAS